MFYWAICFFIVALVAAFFGFSGIAAEAAFFARVVFVVALVVTAVGFLLGRRRLV